MTDSEQLDHHGPVEQRVSAVLGRIELRPQRRRSVRSVVSVPVSVVAGRTEHPGQVTDLGIGGLFVEVDFVPNCGVRLGVLVKHEGKTVRLPAVVRWVDTCGFGAQFESLEPREARVILALLAEARNSLPPGR